MQHFISVLEQYTQIEVIQASWTVFKQNLAHQTVFEDLIKLHNEYLDTIKRQSVDIIQLKDLLQMILSVTRFIFKLTFTIQFDQVVRTHGSSMAKATLVGRQAYAEIVEIEAKFEKYTSFFYNLVKHLAYKSTMSRSGGLQSLKQLCLLLDFNKFYD